MHVEDLLSQTHRLPNVPQAVRQLIQQLNNPDADYAEIAAKVSEDQTLSLRVLRMVNSAHFGLSRKVSSIEDAVVMMGMDRLKTLVIASGLAGSVSDVEGIDLQQFWNESFRVAIVSNYLAERTNQVNADIAFTAGLIHNIGRLLLHLAAPEKAMAIQQLIEETGGSRSEAEMKILGFTTPQAGKALMDMWKFPPELGEAIAQHKNPHGFEEPSYIAAVINLACVVNAASRDGWILEELYQNFPLEVAILAGLPLEIRNDLEEMLTLEFSCDTSEAPA